MPFRRTFARGASACAGALALLTACGADAAGRGIYEPLPLRPKDETVVEKSGELEELFRRRGHLVGDGPALDLVRRLGASVAPSEPADDYVDYRFGIVRSPVPNAFALPDGQIYVHEGLIALLENEAQLAAVLAHEVAHVAGHHSILNARQARKKQGGMVALSVVLGDIGNLINIALVHAVIGYGRDLEEESDRRAFDTLLASGWEVREMPEIFGLLAADPEGERLPVRPAWSSHPLAEHREAAALALIEENAAAIARADERFGGLRVAEPQYQEIALPVALGVVRDLLAADRPRTALWHAERLVARWPDEPRVLALLGDAYRELDARTPTVPEDELTKRAKKSRLKERRRLTRQERERRRLNDPASLPVLEENWQRAEEAYRDALDADPDHPDALRGLGLLLVEREEPLEGGRLLARYLALAPRALDRAIVVRRLAEATDALRQETSR